jgi:ring-1,2-phenylacetyl-CoA epoxidase subunit PaaE
LATRARLHDLTVAAIEPLTDDSIAITFAVPPELADAYAHSAGQHLSVLSPQVGDGIRRSYSICTPAGSGDLRIGVKLLPGGGFSAYAADKLAVGDVLEVLTPVGRFGPRSLDSDAAHSYVAVAAGSGITPVLSIAGTVLAAEPRSQVTLVYANRTARSVMFAEEVADLKDRYPGRFQVLHLLSREPGAGELLSGRLDRERMGRLLDTLLPPDGVDGWFLCGPHAMVTELRDVLVARGVDPATVHSELFHADETPPAEPVSIPVPAAEGEGAEVEMLLDGRRSTLRVPRDGMPILDAALAVRTDAPFSCRGGVCGTCRAKLLEGTVRMDHRYALEDDEVEDGFVLTCQSHPTSDRVVLDYDA